MVKKIQNNNMDGRGVTGKGSSGGFLGSMVRTVPDACNRYSRNCRAIWTVRWHFTMRIPMRIHSLRSQTASQTFRRFLFLKDGKVAGKNVGFMPKPELEAWVKRMYGAVTAHRRYGVNTYGI